MRSCQKSWRDFSSFILGAFVLNLCVWISPLSADPLQLAQEPAGEDVEVVVNLEFLESLEFLEEEAALVDDYEALDKWEGDQNEQ